MISAHIRKSIALLAFALAACDSSTEPTASPDALNETFHLTVRVHLLGSDEFAALNSTFTEAQIDTLFAGLNDIWQQATVVWQIESIIREPALNAEGYRRVLSGASTSPGSVIETIFPRDNLLAGGWNVFVIGDMGSFAGGIYLSSRVVIFPQSGPAGEQGTTGRGPRILAHELGHSLSLAHVPCGAAGNLMSPGCGGRSPAGLTPIQVGAARRQAASGHPF